MLQFFYPLGYAAKYLVVGGGAVNDHSEVEDSIAAVGRYQEERFALVISFVETEVLNRIAI